MALLGKLWDTVFGRKHVSDATDESRRTNEQSIGYSANGQDTIQAVLIPERSRRKDPYFIQIGLDFGTAYCKCVCRDMMLDHAWVHIPKNSEDTNLPFLIPSSVSFDNGVLSRANSVSETYRSGILPHVKMALQSVGLERWNDPVLNSYRDGIPNGTNKDLKRLVQICAIYLLAGILGSVKRDIAKRFPGKVENDYIAVNMAIPVADKNRPEVSEIFEKVLRYAWVMTDELFAKPQISVEDLYSLCRQYKTVANDEDVKNECFAYPEVSANVQAYVRSRTSQKGIYLFSDTGAGTVDQSLFIFHEVDDVEHLTYLYAEVFPLGSSRLEWIAAENDGDTSWKNLERWRQRKEANDDSDHLNDARESVGDVLGGKTRRTIASASKKLRRLQQINDLRVIFGGGGYCENPYGSAVMEQFDSNIFGKDDIQRRRAKDDLFEIRMHKPDDLILEANQQLWMDRLSVAYGLSFERESLVKYTLPSDIETPERIVRQRRVTPAATKDEV